MRLLFVIYGSKPQKITLIPSFRVRIEVGNSYSYIFFNSTLRRFDHVVNHFFHQKTVKGRTVRHTFLCHSRIPSDEHRS
ncbi:MAG: hypothetical protein C4527_26635 [Candidatus Omnitrophota bacterium]|nr:MAG: hypothetical protein C4527_26635 [Candidatus Omnitrophota bacterium]